MKESQALLLITNNISDETLDKVLRFSNPKDVWDELHRLYDGVNEDQLYNYCMEFFRFQKDCDDDIATHVSKLKNIWHKLNAELLKEDNGTELPKLLLICKILDTLPEKYFLFKSSWMLMSKTLRTVENLTSQLCAHEKALGNEGTQGTSGEALAATSRKYQNKKEHKKTDKDESKKVTTKKFRCHFCQEVGHFKIECPKREKEEGRGEATSLMLVEVNKTGDYASDRDNWYVDNGATHHVYENYK